ncbi:MAG: hypothetical protein ACLPTJ_09605 [Solirubrobacteraceae bacterium]
MPNRSQSGARSTGDKRSPSADSADDKRSPSADSADDKRSPSAGGGGKPPPSPDDQVRALYEQMESGSAKAFDEYVSKPSFGSLLAHSAENVAALSRMGSDFADLVLRNMRLAGRADITRLARQLQRSEDKLERVLQEVEQLRDELGDRAGSRQSNGRDPKAGGRPKAER